MTSHLFLRDHKVHDVDVRRISGEDIFEVEAAQRERDLRDACLAFKLCEGFLPGKSRDQVAQRGEFFLREVIHPDP